MFPGRGKFARRQRLISILCWLQPLRLYRGRLAGGYCRGRFLSTIAGGRRCLLPLVDLVCSLLRAAQGLFRLWHCHPIFIELGITPGILYCVWVCLCLLPGLLRSHRFILRVSSKLTLGLLLVQAGTRRDRLSLTTHIILGLCAC